MKRLITIQQGLKSPKDKKGDNGRFKFRSAEDIFEQAKPFLKETETAVIVTDELTEVGGRCAIKATASLIGDSGVIASASGWAILDSHIVSGVDRSGQAYEKKTMSNEQCTGSASSYARKYALCGLFAIDNDENDPDQPSIQPAPEKPAQQPQKPGKPIEPKKEEKAQEEAAKRDLTPLEEEEYTSALADMDAAENVDQLRDIYRRYKDAAFAGKLAQHALGIKSIRGWE